jgi:DNA polymerase-3 subunit alpha
LSKRFEQAIRLEGTKSNQSKHAAGIAISAVPLRESCPMVYDSKNNQVIAGMEMQDLESIGIIKFDILGVAMLDKIMTITDLLKSGV